MATIKFTVKTKSKDPAKLSPLYVRLRSSDVDDIVKTGLKISPDHWDNKKGKTRNKADFTNRDDFENKLRRLETHLKDKLSTTAEIKKGWLAETIERYNNPEIENKVTLFTFIADFIDNAEHRYNPKTGDVIGYKQIREYHTSFNYLKKYAKKENIQLNFPDIDLDFYYRYVEYLQKEGLQKNTIGKKIQTLKIFLNAAAEQGHPVNPQFKSNRFITPKEEVENVYLTEDELEKIYECDLSETPHLDRVRDLFLIGCWTGLRFSDWDQVKPQNIDGDFLEIRQSKTGGKVVIPLHPTVTEILSKYDGNLPRVISNQKFNDALKKIAKKAEIKSTVHRTKTEKGKKISTAHEKHELISTHTARRSFATNLYKAGLPAYSIMQITGHKTEAAFLKYIKVTPREHAEKLRELWQNRRKLKIV